MLIKTIALAGLVIAAQTANAANAPHKWVPGEKIPADAVAAGESGGKPLHVCRITVPSGEKHAGKAQNGNCYVEFGGKEIKMAGKGSEVLVVAGKVAWTPVTDGKVPLTAIVVAESGGAPMFVCVGKVPNGESHPGKAWKGHCYVGFGGKGVKLAQFDVMTVALPGK